MINLSYDLSSSKKTHDYESIKNENLLKHLGSSYSVFNILAER